MHLIEHYEPALTRYQGAQGSIGFAPNRVVALDEFEVLQREDGTIIVGCVSPNSFPLEGAAYLECVAEGEQPLRASRVFRVDSGPFDSTEKPFYIGLPAQLTVNRPLAPRVAELRFSLVNLRYDRDDSDFPPLSMTIGNHTFEVIGVADYAETIKRVRATGETKITAVCTVKRTDGAAIIERLAVHWMHYVCTLLSLARGNKVTWIRYEATDEKTGNTYYVHSAPKTKPFSMQMSILRFENDLALCAADWTQSDTSRSYRRYVSQRVDYLLDALSPNQFLQGNALTSAALVDALANYHAESNGQQYKLGSSAWRRIRDKVKALLEAETAGTEVDLTESLEEIRRYTFATKLERLLTYHDVPTDYIAELKPVRDSLIHRGDFPAGTNRQGRARAYAVLVWTAYAVLMRLSGYHGSIGRLAPSTGTQTQPKVDASVTRRKGKRTRASSTAQTTAASTQPVFDATKLEGFIPIEELKNLELPDFDENNPLHVAFVETLAQAVVRARRQGATPPSETPSDE